MHEGWNQWPRGSSPLLLPSLGRVAAGLEVGSGFQLPGYRPAPTPRPQQSWPVLAWLISAVSIHVCLSRPDQQAPVWAHCCTSLAVKRVFGQKCRVEHHDSGEAGKALCESTDGSAGGSTVCRARQSMARIRTSPSKDRGSASPSVVHRGHPDTRPLTGHRGGRCCPLLLAELRFSGSNSQSASMSGSLWCRQRTTPISANGCSAMGPLGNDGNGQGKRLAVHRTGHPVYFITEVLFSQSHLSLGIYMGHSFTPSAHSETPTHILFSPIFSYVPSTSLSTLQIYWLGP